MSTALAELMDKEFRRMYEEEEQASKFKRVIVQQEYYCKGKVNSFLVRNYPDIREPEEFTYEGFIQIPSSKWRSVALPNTDFTKDIYHNFWTFSDLEVFGGIIYFGDFMLFRKRENYGASTVGRPPGEIEPNLFVEEEYQGLIGFSLACDWETKPKSFAEAELGKLMLQIKERIQNG